MSIVAEIDAAKQRVRVARRSVQDAEKESHQAFLHLLQTLVRCGVIGGCGGRPSSYGPCAVVSGNDWEIRFSLCADCEEKLQAVENELGVGPKVSGFFPRLYGDE